jgi:ParB-like chromosome segregation protein Spo0J
MDLDFSALTDDQLIALIRAACADAVTRGAAVESAAREAYMSADERVQVARASIEADGYTQPIVAHHVEDRDETVDGFHRGRCGKEVPAIRERIHGYLPITRIKADRAGRDDRIAATIRHNRAAGNMLLTR